MNLDLAETVQALREELGKAAAAGAGADIQFPVTQIQLDFHVTIKKEAGISPKVRFWVVELGASGGLSREEIHNVSVTLGTPVDRTGQPVKIGRGFDTKP
jgi:hypothetical protein